MGTFLERKIVSCSVAYTVHVLSLNIFESVLLNPARPTLISSHHSRLEHLLEQHFSTVSTSTSKTVTYINWDIAGQEKKKTETSDGM